MRGFEVVKKIEMAERVWTKVGESWDMASLDELMEKSLEVLERQYLMASLGFLWRKGWSSTGVHCMGGAGARPPPPPTPSVTLFPSSYAAPPSLFHSLLPCPYPPPSPETPLLSSRSPVIIWASGSLRCGSEDSPRCGKERAASSHQLPVLPSPATDAQPQHQGWGLCC